MITALALALLIPATGAPAARSADPPIHVWLNSEKYASGDHARAYIRAAEDGYLVVLRANAEGRIRVLFPLDPGSDNFVRGDHKFEVEGRGGREAFVVTEEQGTGVVLAAWSPIAFNFDSFVRGDHWDYAAFGGQQDSSEETETVLLDIVQRMAGENHFDYDVASYTVPGAVSYDGPSFAPGYVGVGDGWHTGVSVAVGFGVGGWYGPYCGGYWWGPCVSGYWPVYWPYAPYAYYRPFGYYRYGYYPWGYRSYAPYTFRTPGFSSPNSPFPYARARVRTPEGSVVGRSAVAERSWSSAGLRPAEVARPNTVSGVTSRAFGTGRSGRTMPGRTFSPSRRGSSFGGSPRASGGWSRGGGGGGRASVGRGGGGGGGGGGGRRR